MHACPPAEFVIKLAQLEDGLLSKLSAAQGDLAEDEALIVSLERSKALADEISDKVSGCGGRRGGHWEGGRVGRASGWGVRGGCVWGGGEGGRVQRWEGGRVHRWEGG